MLIISAWRWLMKCLRGWQFCIPLMIYTPSISTDPTFKSLGKFESNSLVFTFWNPLNECCHKLSLNIFEKDTALRFCAPLCGYIHNHLFVQCICNHFISFCSHSQILEKCSCPKAAGWVSGIAHSEKNARCRNRILSRMQHVEFKFALRGIYSINSLFRIWI